MGPSDRAPPVFLIQVGGGPRRPSRPGAGPEVAHRELLQPGLPAQPGGGRGQPARQQADVEHVGPVRFLLRGQQVELQAAQADHVQGRGDEHVPAAQVGHPRGRRRGGPAAGKRVPGQPHVPGGQGGPEHHHELVVVGQVALGLIAVVRAEVLHQHLRADDRLGLEDQGRRGQPGQAAERLEQQVRLGLVLAVGAGPLPQSAAASSRSTLTPRLARVSMVASICRKTAGLA